MRNKKQEISRCVGDLLFFLNHRKFLPMIQKRSAGDAQLAEMKFMLNIPLARESVR